MSNQSTSSHILSTLINNTTTITNESSSTVYANNTTDPNECNFVINGVRVRC